MMDVEMQTQCPSRLECRCHPQLEILGVLQYATIPPIFCPLASTIASPRLPTVRFSMAPHFVLPTGVTTLTEKLVHLPTRLHSET